jgi:uncharacterized membrane protein AbrB (regulator of aidB expression)
MTPQKSTASQQTLPVIEATVMSSPLHLLAYLLAGLGGGLLALRSGIPAAPLAGALLGAGLVSLSGRLDLAQWPLGTRTTLEIGIGTVIGTSLTSTALTELRQLWKPALLIAMPFIQAAAAPIPSPSPTQFKQAIAPPI